MDDDISNEKIQKRKIISITKIADEQSSESSGDENQKRIVDKFRMNESNSDEPDYNSQNSDEG